MIKILIIKFGALGDVVRTSFFAKPLKCSQSRVEISWLTSKVAVDILKHNPYIDNIYTNFSDISNIKFNTIYSLDDERDIVTGASSLNADILIGAYLDEGIITYSENASLWFDMGVHSKYGIKYANQQKKSNDKSHAQIFKKIFNVQDVDNNFYYEQGSKKSNRCNNGKIKIGLFPHSGGRWPSKALRKNEVLGLLEAIIYGEVSGAVDEIRLFGSGGEFVRNLEISEAINSKIVKVVNSENNLQGLSLAIQDLDVMISSDSLPLHLAIANKIFTISFYTATSAAEIETFDNGVKILSTSADYCSYDRNADNSSITSARVYSELIAFIKTLAANVR